MTRNRLIALVVVAIAVVAGIWFVAGRGGGTGSAGAEPSATVPPVAESNTITSDARAIPVHHVELAAPGAGGVVAEVMVAEGDTVTAGQPLLRLDGTQLDAQLQQAIAAADGAKASAAQARAAAIEASAQLSTARANVDAANAGVKSADATRDGVPSGGSARRAADAEVDRAQAAARAARGQQAAAAAAVRVANEAEVAATAEVHRAEAAVTAAQAALDELTVQAPFNGVVASLDAVVGQTVSPPDPVARIADPSGWRFETIDLDEAAIGRLAVGANATVNVDAFEDVDIPATVESISEFGESSAGDIVYTVVLVPTGTVPDGLRWNMTASAQIEAAP